MEAGQTPASASAVSELLLICEEEPEGSGGGSWMSLEGELTPVQEMRVKALCLCELARGTDETGWVEFWDSMKREQGNDVLEFRLGQVERDANAMDAEGRKYDVSRAIRCKKPSLEESRQSIASKVCK